MVENYTMVDFIHSFIYRIFAINQKYNNSIQEVIIH